MAANKLAGYRYVKSFLEQGPVLEVGCARGEDLETMPPGSLGLEILPEFIEICRQKGLNVKETDLNEPLPIADESFQTVFCSHVLEHVLAPIRLLSELRRVCKVNGHVVLGLPLESSLFDWHRKYFINSPYHIYAFTPRNISHMMNMVGLKAIGLWYDFPRRLRFIEKPLNWVSPLVSQLAPSYWTVGLKTGQVTAFFEQYTNKQLLKNWLEQDKKRNRHYPNNT
jgi:SAM-dependent methyltransferase